MTNPYTTLVNYITQLAKLIREWWLSNDLYDSDISMSSVDGDEYLDRGPSLCVRRRDGTVDVYVESECGDATVEARELIPEFKVVPITDPDDLLDGFNFYVKIRNRWVLQGEIIELFLVH